MTVTSEVTLAEGVGDGAADEFSFSPITVYDEDDLVVVLRTDDGSVADETLTRGTGTNNYSVTLNSTQFLPSTGYITFPASGSSWLAVGETLLIRRVMDMTQEVDLENQGGYFPDTQEQALDKLTMLDLQQQEELDRAIKARIGSTITDFELPEPDASKVLGWDADGEAIVNVDPGFTQDSSALITVSDIEPAYERGRVWITETGAAVFRVGSGADYQPMFTVDETGNYIQMDSALRVTFSGLPPIFNSSGSGELLHLIQTSDDSSPVQLLIVKDRDGGTPLDGEYIGYITAMGPTDANPQDTYAQIRFAMEDVTDGAVDGSIEAYTTIAGTPTLELHIEQGLTVGAATGGNPGLGKINATGYEINGNPVPVSELSVQSGTTHAPSISDHGKVFYYTNASGCTITLPAISSVFEGYKITTINLVDDHSFITTGANDAIGTWLVIATTGADVMYGGMDNWVLPATPGFNRQTWAVINGEWHTLETRWVGTSAIYNDGTAFNFDTGEHADLDFGTLVPTKWQAGMVCIDTDQNFSVGDGIPCSVTVESNASVNTLGLAAQYGETANNGVNTFISGTIGSGGITIFQANAATTQAVAANDKWTIFLFAGF